MHLDLVFMLQLNFIYKSAKQNKNWVTSESKIWIQICHSTRQLFTSWSETDAHCFIYLHFISLQYLWIKIDICSKTTDCTTSPDINFSSRQFECMCNKHTCMWNLFFFSSFFYRWDSKDARETNRLFTNTNQNLFPESEPINELHSEIKMAAKKQWKVVTGTVVGQSESIRYHVNTWSTSWLCRPKCDLHIGYAGQNVIHILAMQAKIWSTSLLCRPECDLHIGYAGQNVIYILTMMTKMCATSWLWRPKCDLHIGYVD